ncbi:DHH family phosphoesterase [archaeon]|jgi:single-stranded DNA-specific DHH superfamily exonuclease|nr:DHH family phosphoesterase [archaeon]MBT3451648.1 DHH family phosphoesterase [archaeon]MBT6869669.1 DHH family phosphoesterase [archaeon]MBT7192437.1 DHH family phosphoesterase [archaeon]MBT7380238.1 DHH family phosphoesterase [archaeon]
MLSTKEVKEIREALQSFKSPLFIYDDDPDGLCSFLLLYDYVKEGRGVILKTSSSVDANFIKLIHLYQFDSVFILDTPIVEQDFIDQIKVPVYWVDHHEVLKRNNVKYYNPRKNDPEAYIPTTRMAYQVNPNPDKLWLAMLGCLSDYMIPDFKNEFLKRYPDLMDKKSEIGDALFKDQIGELERVFRFLLKGKSSEVRKCINILTRIKTPYEILNQETSKGKYLWKRFQKIDVEYQKMYQFAQSKKTRSKLLLYEYNDNKWSFTAYLSNELSTKNPKKVVIIARKSNGSMKVSLRAKFNIRDALKRTLEKVEGKGGGHPNACGAVIEEHDWEHFLNYFKQEIDKDYPCKKKVVKKKVVKVKKDHTKQSKPKSVGKSVKNKTNPEKSSKHSKKKVKKEVKK